MAVDVVPARVADAPVVQHHGLPLVRLAPGELAYVPRADFAERRQLRAIEKPCWHIASRVAARNRLAARGVEHEPAVGQIARIGVLQQDRLAPFPRLHRVAGTARERAYPAAVRRRLVDEVAMVHHGELAVGRSKVRVAGIDAPQPVEALVLQLHHGRRAACLRVGLGLARVVAEREDDAVAVPVQIRIEDRAPGQLVLQKHRLVRRLLPVVDRHEAGSRTRPATGVLIRGARLLRERQPALHGQEPLELEVWMLEEDAAANGLELARRVTHLARVIRLFRVRVPLLVNGQLRLESCQLCLGHTPRHILVRAVRKGDDLLRRRRRHRGGRPQHGHCRKYEDKK